MMLLHVLYLAAICRAWPTYGGLQDPGNCNPLVEDSHCPADSAFAGKKSFDFVGASSDDFDKFWSVDNQTNEHRGHDGQNGLLLRMAGSAQAAPTLISRQYLLFGKVTVKAKAARGAGLVSTIVLKSDSGDEIDWEMLGAYQNQAQSNYFYNGQPLFNTYNTTYSISSSSYDDFHTYTVEWTDELLRFSIDGAERKTWKRADDDDNNNDNSSMIPAAKWPQTPMQVRLGLWATKPSDDPGEIAWAGGVPDWKSHADDGDDSNNNNNNSKPPFTVTFSSVDVEDYTGWCEEIESGAAVDYQYDSKTRGWANVRVAGCHKRRNNATGGGGGGGGDDGDSKNGTDAADSGDENGSVSVFGRGGGGSSSLFALATTMFVVGYMVL